jgi:hypothetical protein
MNTQEENNDKVMREHFNPELIEKAPHGFTEKVMTLVSLEAKPVKAREKLSSRIIVPAISAAVTIILTVTALLLPASGYDSATLPWLKILKNLNLPAFNLDLDSLLSFNLPAYLPYLFLCILFLTLFDRGLSGLFHRGK